MTFLDLDIRISDRKFVVKLFDKRDSFPFSIVRMPYRQSNIPTNMFNAAISAEVLRIARATTNKADFKTSCHTYFQRMTRQGASDTTISRILKKLFGRFLSSTEIKTCKQNFFLIVKFAHF